MNVLERTAKGRALLVMAEAVVAGRAAGHSAATSVADNPFDVTKDRERHLAWRRGFWVGRALDH